MHATYRTICFAFELRKASSTLDRLTGMPLRMGH